MISADIEAICIMRLLSRGRFLHSQCILEVVPRGSLVGRDADRRSCPGGRRWLLTIRKTFQDRQDMLRHIIVYGSETTIDSFSFEKLLPLVEP